jgi:hypothetical protein
MYVTGITFVRYAQNRNIGSFLEAITPKGLNMIANTCLNKNVCSMYFPIEHNLWGSYPEVIPLTCSWLKVTFSPFDCQLNAFRHRTNSVGVNEISIY